MKRYKAETCEKKLNKGEGERISYTDRERREKENIYTGPRKQYETLREISGKRSSEKEIDVNREIKEKERKKQTSDEINQEGERYA